MVLATDGNSSFVLFVYLELEWYQSEMRRMESQSGSGGDLFEHGTSGNNPLLIKYVFNEAIGHLLEHNSPCSAQAGINRGDGTNFYVLPGSGTSDILLLSNTSYVNISGVWIFQVDSGQVSIGGM